MAETTTAPKTESNDKILAAVATLPLVGLVMYYAMKDASPLVKHYAKQSNALLAIQIVSMIVTTVLSAVIIGVCLGPVISLIGFVLWIMLLIKALNEDETYVLPVIGEYFDKMLK